MHRSKQIRNNTGQRCNLLKRRTLRRNFEIKLLHYKIGSLLFYGKSVDMMLLVSLSTLVLAIFHRTEAMSRAMVQMLNYCTTHPYAVIRYKQSDMILEIHSNSSYLPDPKAGSREGGHFSLTNKPKQFQHMMNNVAVYVLSTIIHNVMSLIAEAGLAALYLNAKYGVFIRNMLE